MTYEHDHGCMPTSLEIQQHRWGLKLLPLLRVDTVMLWHCRCSNDWLNVVAVVAYAWKVNNISKSGTLRRKFSSSRWVLVTVLEEESDHFTWNTEQNILHQDIGYHEKSATWKRKWGYAVTVKRTRLNCTDWRDLFLVTQCYIQLIQHQNGNKKNILNKRKRTIRCVRAPAETQREVPSFLSNCMSLRNTFINGRSTTIRSVANGEVTFSGHRVAQIQYKLRDQCSWS